MKRVGKLKSLMKRIEEREPFRSKVSRTYLYSLLEKVAELLNMPYIRVLEIATFYTMFNLQPVGRHHLQVCMTLSCSLMGADRLYAHLSRKLGIGHGETTADGRFTLRKVECLAACGRGPCMQVGFDYHDNLTEANVDALLEKLK